MRGLAIVATLLGAAYFGGSAAIETGSVLAGGGSISPGMVTPWLLCALSLGLLWRLDARTALLSVAAASTVTALVVLSSMSAMNSPPGYVAFGAVALVMAVAAGGSAVVSERRIARVPNPLRDYAASAFDDPPIFEVGGVQYVSVWDDQAQPAALRARVVLQNCHDTPAVVRVRLEEDAVTEPGVVLPDTVAVDVGPEGWALLDLVCPVRPGHRGEGWFHLSVRVDRERTGARTRLWRAPTGASWGLTATQLLHGLAGGRRSQYLGMTVALPPAEGAPGEVTVNVRPLSEDALAGALQDGA